MTNLRPTPRLFSVLLALLVAASASPAGAQRVFKWVDEQGNVHYADTVPPKDQEQERTQLDKRGLTVKRIEAAKTAEEVAREQELKRLREEQAKVESEQRASDQVLLRTFRSDDDILMARDGKVAAIDTLIEVTRGSIGRLKEQLADMQRAAADLERQGKPVPRRQIDDMEAVRRQIGDNYSAIVTNEESRKAIIERYEADLRRFRHLRTPETAGGSFAPAKTRMALIDTVVACPDAAACDEMWMKGDAYLRANATTPIRLSGSFILATATPRKDDEYSLTLSRLPDREGSGVRLFLDLQCRETTQGRELCDGARVKAVREGFRRALSTP
jgi:hypothetical protein